MLLSDLHHVIQAVMGWNGTHLYQFNVDAPYDGVGYGMPDPYFGEREDARQVPLNQRLNSEHQKIFYTYDFGDDWFHVIQLENVEKMDELPYLPQFLGGKRRGAIEDCGGMGGYLDLLDALEFPEHPEHKKSHKWAKQNGFDPAQLDVFAVENALLREFPPSLA